MPDDSITVSVEGNEIKVDDENEHVRRKARMDWLLTLNKGDVVEIEFDPKDVEQENLEELPDDDDEEDFIDNGKLKGPFRKKKNQTENPARGVYRVEASADGERTFRTGRVSVYRGIFKSNKWKYTVRWTRDGKALAALDPHVSVKRNG